MPHLRRLYLKGNGPSSVYQMITLSGGHEWLQGLSQLEELYLGLVAFVALDGAQFAGLSLPARPSTWPGAIA
jgi:hypothetical protein